MALVKNNPFSCWIKGQMFDNWASASGVPITDGPPELVWVDVETTGLDRRCERTLALGLVLTDRVGNVCRDGLVDWLIWDDYERDGRPSCEVALAEMDPFVREMHKKNGLIVKLRNARMHPARMRLHPAEVGLAANEWLSLMVGAAAKLPMSGANPASFDRGFVQDDLPILANWFHYRSGVDVSATREVAKRVNPLILEDQPKKSEVHMPIPDILDSIKLYRYLLENFLILDNATKEMM